MKKQRPTCWIKQAWDPAAYKVYDTKPSWTKFQGSNSSVWALPAGSICYPISGQTLSALIGDEWELPKEGELLQVEDGVPTWLHFN